jgi:hypothetical protein
MANKHVATIQILDVLDETGAVTGRKVTGHTFDEHDKETRTELTADNFQEYLEPLLVPAFGDPDADKTEDDEPEADTEADEDQAESDEDETDEPQTEPLPETIKKTKGK